MNSISKVARTECAGNGMSDKPVIYVVDDEEIIAFTLTTILKCHGFEARAFNSAEEVLADASGLRPSLLITDVVMGGLKGIELAVRFKTINPQCKVLLVSGKLATGELLNLARTEGHDFTILAKPVRPEEILKQVSRLIPHS